MIFVGIVFALCLQIRHSIPCHMTDISCGKPCGKPQPCGNHKCQRICHKVSALNGALLGLYYIFLTLYTFRTLKKVAKQHHCLALVLYLLKLMFVAPIMHSATEIDLLETHTIPCATCTLFYVHVCLKTLFLISRIFFSNRVTVGVLPANSPVLGFDHAPTRVASRATPAPSVPTPPTVTTLSS